MSKSSPWTWIPTLYFAEGIPYFVVNVISVTMFKRLGMPNGELSMWTSLLYLPWVVKPLWSPFVDSIRSKRWWILAMQAGVTVLFAALSLSVSPDVFGWSLVVFYLTAFASATHDIAADGFYMLALSQHEQSLFVGIRSLFYRISSVFGQGIIVVLAGVLETRLGDVPKAWSLTLMGAGALFLLLTLFHMRALPKVERSAVRQGQLLANVGESFRSFFAKPGILLAMLFMLLYRLPEALSVKMLTPFLLDPVEVGGLGLSTAQSGIVYGTIGVISLTIGGILGGYASSRWGLRKSMWPMALSLALPCAVYLYLALAQPSQLWIVSSCVALDQFGYGFGFTAYMLFMIWFSEGRFPTSHYSVCTAFMALSMMIPGLFAGALQEVVGYVGFFGIVMLCCLATVMVTLAASRKIEKDYGKK